MSQDILLAIDQGTSSSRAIAFSAAGEMLAIEQQSFEQIYPAPGWVEHDAEVIWATAMSTSRRVLQRLREAGSAVAAVGITNQRETTVLWDRRSGAPLYNAIVWQDRRTADRCRELNRPMPRRSSTARPACSSIRIFPPPKSRGFWIAYPERAMRPKPVTLPSAPSTVSCSGASAAAGCTRPMPPTRAARRSTTFAKAVGTRRCAKCSTCPSPVFPRCGTARAISDSSTSPCSARPCRSGASPAINKRR